MASPGGGDPSCANGAFLILLNCLGRIGIHARPCHGQTGPSEGMIPVPVIPDPCHEPVEHTCAFTVSSDVNQHDFCVRDPDAEQRSCFSPEVTACLQSFKSSHFVWPPRTSPNQPARSWDFSKPGYLDLFSGCRGVAKAVSRIADTWSLCIDIAQDPNLDLLAAELREKLEFLISAKVFFAVGAAPVRGSFSIAVTPAVRDITCPQGKPNISENMQKKVEIGNSFFRWLVRVAALCLNRDLAFWVENPDRSWLWRQPEWRDLLLDSRTGFWKVTFCSFGAPWKKPTKVLTNTFLKDHVSPLPGCLHHVPLRGFSSKHKKPWTKVAEPYPKRFSGHLGQSIAGYSGLFSSTGRFNVADCAKVTNERIGEASLPGPRARRGHSRPPRELPLGQVQLVTVQTERLQSQIWLRFEGWVKEGTSAAAAATLVSVPFVLCWLVAEFGRLLYSNGESLYLFRHLILAMLKHFPLTRQHTHVCWTLVAKWEPRFQRSS